MMDHADSPRRGDLDGRGNLSRMALKEFCEWFLSVMLDHIRFTRAIFKLETLDDRHRRLLRDLGHDKRSEELIGAILKYGRIERGDASIALKTSERTARNVLSALISGGFLKSSTPKGPVRIAFPLDHRDRLFPSLFADGTINAPEPPIIQGAN
jgi:Fic family protein